jgi:hypothetical protein
VLVGAHNAQAMVAPITRIHITRWLRPLAGVTCKACSDKSDLVSKVREVIHLPELPLTEYMKGVDKDGMPMGDMNSGEGMPLGPDGKPDINALLERLKNIPGMDNMKARSTQH